LQLSDIEDALRAHGLTPRGAFHPEAEDQAPEVTPGVVARTIVLAGHVGPNMWQAFAANGEPEPGSLDPWSEVAFSEVAARFGGKAISPFKKPYLPFQRWARRAGPCHPSPLGIFIHPDYGLWHAFRGAIAFPEQFDVPAPDNRPSPCESCEDRRCLSTCPVDEDCMALACRARRSCPVGRTFRYQPAQAGFHMSAFLRNRLRASDPHMNNMG
jgi:hypothetical protein